MAATFNIDTVEGREIRGLLDLKFAFPPDQIGSSSGSSQGLTGPGLLSFTCDMLTSAALGLLALLRRMRSFGHTIKSLILRCLLLWPHLLRSLQCIWPLCSGTDLKGAPKRKGDQERPTFLGASGGCEGYTTIHAVQVPNRSSGSHLPLESRSTTSLVGPGAGQSQGAPHTGSPVLSIAPSSSSTQPRPSDRHFQGGSTSSIATTYRIPF